VDVGARRAALAQPRHHDAPLGAVGMEREIDGVAMIEAEARSPRTVRDEAAGGLVHLARDAQKPLRHIGATRHHFPAYRPGLAGDTDRATTGRV
jgi:hypothetical protein